MVEPSHAELKYEYDHQRQMFRLDRRLFSATVYPADYGFVLATLVGDGDPWTPWSWSMSPPSRAV